MINSQVNLGDAEFLILIGRNMLVHFFLAAALTVFPESANILYTFQERE